MGHRGVKVRWKQHQQRTSVMGLSLHPANTTGILRKQGKLANISGTGTRDVPEPVGVWQQGSKAELEETGKVFDWDGGLCPNQFSTVLQLQYLPSLPPCLGHLLDKKLLKTGIIPSFFSTGIEGFDLRWSSTMQIIPQKIIFYV